MTQSGWGGKRAGAGRPQGSTKETSNQRPQHQVRAFPEEWELIKKFAKLVKDNPEKAKKMLQNL